MDEEEGDLFTIPACSHTYHLHCIARWKRQSKKCPYCRGMLPDEIGSTLSRLRNLPTEPVLPEMTWYAIFGNVVLGIPCIAYPLILVVLVLVLESAFLGIFIVLTFFIANYLILFEDDQHCSAISVSIILCLIFPLIVVCLVAAFVAQILYMFYRMMSFYVNACACKIRWSGAFDFIISRTMTISSYLFDMLS